MAAEQRQLMVYQYGKPRKVVWQLAAMQTGLRALGALLPGVARRLVTRLFFTPGRRAVSRSAEVTLAAAERLKILHGGRELAAYAWGEGPVILLVHGWGARASAMHRLVEPLTARGFRVVAFDAPAHGASPGQQTHLVQFGDAARAVIEQCGPVYGVFGHSIGGAATMFMLSRERGVNVEKVVLNGSPSEMTGVVETFTTTLDLPEGMARGLRESIFDRVGLPVETLSVARVAASLSVEALVIHDRQDEVIPFGEGKAIARSWPEARFVATEGLGHRGALRDEGAIGQVAAFFGNGVVSG